MRIVLLLIFVLSGTLIFSQSIMISGQVVGDNKEGIDLALISLMSATDSANIKATYTDIDGSFQLTNIVAGAYVLRINLLGYEDYTKALTIENNDLELAPIVLGVATQELDAVTVTAKVPFVERKIDRTVINPEGLISAAGNNALEVLEKAPGISLNSDGSIMLKGRSGVAVYINDKPSYLSGTELESYLRSLPAGSVKRIEIMTNPPAKYEAAGNSGIINIVTKRNTLLGFSGNVAASIRQGRFSSSNNNLNLNFNQKKWSFYANIYAGFYKTYQDLNINRFYNNENDVLQSSFSQNSYILRNGQYLNTKFGADYYLSEKTTLGISLKNNRSPTTRDTDNTANTRNAEKEDLLTILADNIEDNTFNNEVYNAYISHKLDTLGSTISLDADYVIYGSGSDQEFKNDIYDANATLTFSDIINGDLPSEIKIYAAKTDYTKQIGKTTKFEAGLKTAFTQTDNEAIYTTTVDGTTTPDYGLSNRFLYDEWINAGYVNFSRSFGKVDLQAGLRGESTTLEGNQLGNAQKPDTSFTRTYNSLFPTFYASWRMDTASVNVLTFSYSRRIDRPYFQDLNPFISPLDKFTFYTGNPDLLPTFSNNFSLSYSWKNIFNTTLNYSKTIDGINETLEIRDGIYYSRPGNIASNQSFTLSVDASLPIAKWYNLNSYVELGHLRFDSPLYSEQLASSGTYVYLSANNSFQLGNGWKASVSANYRSDLVYAQLILKSYGQLNFGVQKSLFDKKGNIKLAVDDFLFTRTSDGIINNLRQTDADWNGRRDTRRVTLTFSIRFGNSNNNKKKRNSSGSDSEQRRVRG